MFHQFARSDLIVQTYAPKAANQIERLVVRHKDTEATSSTSDKTWF